MIVTNNLNKEVNEDYKIIMKSLENMEFTITNLNSDSISDAINDIKPNAILNIKEELYTVNAKLAELISYMLQKVESLGHGKVALFILNFISVRARGVHLSRVSFLANHESYTAWDRTKHSI